MVTLSGESDGLPVEVRAVTLEMPRSHERGRALSVEGASLAVEVWRSVDRE